MDRSIEQALIDCLEAVDRGEAIGEILSRYPERAPELRPILETAARLTTLNLQPTVAAQTKSRQTFLAQAEAVKGVNPARRRPSFSFWLRPLIAITFLAILVVGLINISASALPGDALYGAKLFLEEAQLTLTGDGASLEERFRQNRIAEIENLLRQNREANVAFTGIVDEMLDDTWRVEGLLVAVAAANIGGDPQMGDVVEVMGWVGNGRLVANTIAVTMKSESYPAYEATETPSPTATFEPTATAEATGETAVPTQTMGSSPTSPILVTPTPTTTSTPNPPTATPEPHPDPVPPYEDDDDNSGSGSDDDNSGPGNDNNNSGSGNDDDNSGSGSDDDNSGSGSDDDNSGSGSDDDNSGSGGDRDDD